MFGVVPSFPEREVFILHTVCCQFSDTLTGPYLYCKLYSKTSSTSLIWSCLFCSFNIFMQVQFNRKVICCSPLILGNSYIRQTLFCFWSLLYLVRALDVQPSAVPSMCTISYGPSLKQVQVAAMSKHWFCLLYFRLTNKKEIGGISPSL